MLQHYLDRIGYDGPLNVDVATLTAIHRQHLLTFPYENLDVQLGVPLDTDPEKAWDKLVNRGRGGWCYEMNGVLGKVLEEIGFTLTRVAGGVGRFVRGDDAFGNHLVLLTELDGTWIVDAGFGDGFIDPVPLTAGKFEQRGFRFELEFQDDGYWRVHNHQHGAAPSFDFSTEAADQSLFDAQCQMLQTNPESPFVKTVVCQRYVPEGYEIQVSRIAKSVTPGGVNERVLDSREEFADRLSSVFNLHPTASEVDTLWEKAVAQYDLWLASQAESEKNP